MLFPAGTAPDAGDAPGVEIRLDRIRWTRPRDFGDVWLGWHLWQRLGLDGSCETALNGIPAEVPGAWIAAIPAINRLCAPGSELAIEVLGLDRVLVLLRNRLVHWERLESYCT